MSDYVNYWKRRRLYVPRRTVLKAGGLTAVGGAALGLVGCGGDDDDDTGNGNGNGETPSNGDPTPTTAAGETPANGNGQPTGTIRVAYSSGLTFFNPLTYTAGGQILYRDAVGEGLVNTAAGESSVELYGALAQSYEASPDGLTWTFNLNPDARFHDDTPVLAEDVKFSWEFMKADESRHARKSEIASVLDEVETPDEMTAIFHLNQPYPQMDFRSNNWPIIPLHAYNELGLDGLEQQPIAAGPFRFVSGVKDQQVRLAAVEGHYRKTPYVAEYHIDAVTEEATRIARLETGEADIINITAVSREQVEGISGATIHRAEGVIGSWLVFMDPYLGVDSPTNNPEVRKAMSIAINRQGIVDGLFSGEATLGGSYSLPYLNGYLDLPPDPYDLADARARLDAAGFGDGFEVDFHVISPVAEFVAVMQEDWAEIGIQTNLNVLDGAAWVNMVNGHETPGIYIEPTGADYIDPASYGLFTFSDGTFSYVNEYDDDVSMVVNGADNEARYEAFRRIQQGIYDSTIYANLWYQNQLNASGPNVASWTPIPNNGYIVLIEHAQLAS